MQSNLIQSLAIVLFFAVLIILTLVTQWDFGNKHKNDSSNDEFPDNPSEDNSQDTEINDNVLLFAKTHNNATIPTKEYEDGCYDLYVSDRTKDIEIPPHTNKLIDTGIATAFSPKYRLAVRERGSNTKSNMIVMAGQVDSGYRGSIFVSIYNGNNVPIVLSRTAQDVGIYEDKILVPNSKAIAQFAMEEVPVMDEREVDYKYLKSIPSKRGTGALGSSGK